MTIEMQTRISGDTVSVLLTEGNRCSGGLDAMKTPSGTWYLSRLVVKPEVRGQGWGRKMVEWLQSQVKAIIVTPSGYDMEQDKIEAFYKHMGFVDTAEGFIWECSKT
jgi:predicted GNAT family N-acyltransferase